MDKLRKETDKELKKIEDELARIYSDAEDELREKWTKYFDRAEKRVASFGKAYEDAVKSGDADAIAAAKKQLQEKIASATFRDKQFQDMIDGVTERMSHVNQIALEYVNGKMPDMYRYNYNGTLNAMKTEAKNAGIDGVAFNLLDEKTVERMVKRGEVTLPNKKIDVAKDKAWNKKAINSQLMQGIIQGESIPQMSKRFEAVTDMDKEAAIRNARTMTTEAENGGRMDSMREAEEMGLQYEKIWMSTHDDRTRESHALMDGEAVPLDEKFSNGLEYPGDPNGEPEEVYNCRCSLVRKLVGYKGHSIKANSYEPTFFDDVKEQAAKATPAEKIDVDKVVPENVRSAIDDFYDKYANAKTEHYIAINKDGEIIFESGTQKGKASVSVPQSVNEGNEGGFSVHNHPAPTTFSDADVKNYEISGQHGFVIDKDNNEYILYNTNPVSKYKEIDAIPITSHYDEDYAKVMPFSTSLKTAFDEIEEKTAKERRTYFAEIQRTVADKSERAKLAQEWMKEHSEEKLKLQWLKDNSEEFGFVFVQRKRR